ncbi:hypothetical protein pb186bvf_011376 [Paramecium bursaria]
MIKLNPIWSQLAKSILTDGFSPSRQSYRLRTLPLKTQRKTSPVLLTSYLNSSSSLKNRRKSCCCSECGIQSKKEFRNMNVPTIIAERKIKSKRLSPIPRIQSPFLFQRKEIKKSQFFRTQKQDVRATKLWLYDKDQTRILKPLETIKAFIPDATPLHIKKKQTQLRKKLKLVTQPTQLLFKTFSQPKISVTSVRTIKINHDYKMIANHKKAQSNPYLSHCKTQSTIMKTQ